jgi:hypothetical protein
MEPKKPVRRSRKKNTVQLASSGSLSDSEVEEIVSFLWENIDALPGHVQSLLMSSQEPGAAGVMSYVLAAGWALGKFDYVLADPFKGTKSGWISKTVEVN